ncbi:MAG: hypothetical protein COX77_02175 [Candidatus Komeilibacteria bacterium CG_4_10_14_0_2_um_filter_37_10]|uniref:Uncharacterized protein n=1 Tax=Candidatus Komeilibacteria bacterium CG_4_10_14_0_2_um_filter_37_10 TaxID=1974470 RepID=A0A2M7VF49_9BACT|nr:MAG: hypothetical protein COX77_02175 [Candidatus Komeilibacteria bacterium CG_4_10_14_0_2_um_filter_37_10]
MSYRNIRRHDIPRWYGLSYQDNDEPKLILSIHQDLIPQLEEINENAPLIKYYQDHYKLGVWQRSATKHFGFGNTFVNNELQDGWLQLATTLRQSWQKINCTACNSKGERSWQKLRVCDDDQFCSTCRGLRFIYQYDDIWLSELLINLHILFSILSTNDTATISNKEQLLTIDTCFHDGGKDVGGEISKKMRHWIMQSATRDLQARQILLAMTQVYTLITPPSFCDDFAVELDPSGGFSLRCPGQNCCSIYASAQALTNNNDGYKLGSHNID